MEEEVEFITEIVTVFETTELTTTKPIINPKLTTTAPEESLFSKYAYSLKEQTNRSLITARN